MRLFLQQQKAVKKGGFPIVRDYLRHAVWSVVLVAMLAPRIANAALVDVIEYYHATFDHYFVTADANEIAKLDSGYFTGWQRTGERFTVIDAATTAAGSTPVCRFYGNPQFGLDSHFYSASPAECNAVRAMWPEAWLLESSNVFQVYLPNPSTGSCPAGSVPIYRAWNGRTDSNHRYTASVATLNTMTARGYVAEGYGPGAMPVAMCSPTTVPAGAVPQCTIAASSASPVVGTSVVLSASCSGAPTGYVWSGCSSTSASCTARSDTPGVITYGVTARNANGSGPAAAVDVAWRTAAAPLPPPVCTISVTTVGVVPVIDSTAVLSASCSNLPGSYSWTGCSSDSSTCYVSEMMSGTRSYSLVASNRGGASAPASVSIDWAATAPPAPDFCGPYPSLLHSAIPWTETILYSVSSPPPGFAWNGVWVGRITIPPGTSASGSGRIDVAEYAGGPLPRDVTVSRFACDFRPQDSTGNNGPVLRANGSSFAGLFTVGPSSLGYAELQAGRTYYVNIRNASADGTISCPAAAETCGALLYLRPPR